MDKQLELDFSSGVESKPQTAETKVVAEVIDFWQLKRSHYLGASSLSGKEKEQMHRRIDSLLARYK